MNLDYEAAASAAEQVWLDGGSWEEVAKATVDAAVPKPCRHGNYAPHPKPIYAPGPDGEKRIMGWGECDGKPEVEWPKPESTIPPREYWLDGKPEAD